MSTETDHAPAYPEKYSNLCGQAKASSTMIPAERMELLESMRQAFYGYDPASHAGIERVFTVVDTRTDKIISQIDFGAYRKRN